MRTIHQNPVDEVRHQARLDCPCRPETEELLGDSGKWELLVIHQALEVARVDHEGAAGFRRILDWVADGTGIYVRTEGDDLVVRIPASEPAFIEARSGSFLARGLGGDPFTVRPIPADIVEEEQS